jgi:hypothetical protein
MKKEENNRKIGTVRVTNMWWKFHVACGREIKPLLTEVQFRNYLKVQAFFKISLNIIGCKYLCLTVYAIHFSCTFFNKIKPCFVAHF